MSVTVNCNITRFVSPDETCGAVNEIDAVEPSKDTVSPEICFQEYVISSPSGSTPMPVTVISESLNILLSGPAFALGG